MDICIYHVDYSGSVTLYNVVSVEFYEGEVYIDCIGHHPDGFTYLDRHCYYITDIRKIEVLKVYDYRNV